MLERGLLLLALGLGLASTQGTLEEVPVQPGFDAQKMEGRWFTMQLATSHTDLVLPTDPLRLALHSIWTREGGDLALVLFWIGEGVCRGMNVTIHPAGLPGQYQGSSRRMLEDPAWLGKYWEYVEKFRLQSAPVFNVPDFFLNWSVPFPVSKACSRCPHHQTAACVNEHSAHPHSSSQVNRARGAAIVRRKSPLEGCVWIYKWGGLASCECVLRARSPLSSSRGAVPP
uniref:beta-lactoglobulin isoform X2 n=1 Tax=Ictidomys tridecemlineatus TaxID=43179 RepID=UPI001A9D1FFB|nr:beta-lactoglobulin isoform X2 [Ictidomys tridecemlineatus]